MITASRPRHREQLFIVLERLRATALELLDLVGALAQVCAVHVAQRDHFHAANLECGLDIHHAVPTAADQAKLERALRGGGAQHRRERGECRRAHGGKVQELAARDGVHERSVASRTGRDKLKNTTRAEE
jgi:hypothetical protein